ncbi:hypothetical protein AVEN_110867-1 [Araneus ventricosus]|uniref:Uncharacterized protein n=1 Tax=Araneus ventricosus TaxID=182803 RepID=A0A4Y2VC80_ARAVE|nr:hypothetical protein AVEN_110867-1 [Araneus ventricosus]
MALLFHTPEGLDVNEPAAFPLFLSIWADCGFIWYLLMRGLLLASSSVSRDASEWEEFRCCLNKSISKEYFNDVAGFEYRLPKRGTSDPIIHLPPCTELIRGDIFTEAHQSISTI